MRLFIGALASVVVAAALAPVALAGGSATIIATVKTAGKMGKPVKASLKLAYRPRFYPARDLCSGCKFVRQFDAKLRAALKLWYQQGKKAKALKRLQDLRTPLVRNRGGQFNVDPAEEIATYLSATIKEIRIAGS